MIQSILANADAFRWLLFLVLLWAFYRFMKSDENSVTWQDFISAKGPDGHWHGDINKLGQVTGIVFGSVAIVLVSTHAKDDFTGFAAVLGVYFSFVGGAAAYSAYLRAKMGRKETEVTQEPIPDPATTKTTTKTTEPAKQEDAK